MKLFHFSISHYDKPLSNRFPQSVLRNMKYDEATINHFANFWILAKNQNKSAMDPEDYFEGVDDSVLAEEYIDRSICEVV